MASPQAEPSADLEHMFPGHSGMKLMRLMMRLLALAAAYVVAAWLGQQVAFEHGAVSPVWPATGLAIAALALWGQRLWPAIALGAFLSSLLFATHSAPVAACIAAGNSLEALLGAWALHRLGVRGEVRRVRDALALVAVALAAPLPAATGGALSLTLGGFSAWEHYPWVWLVWWLGNCMGALIVLPLLLAWAGERSPVADPARPFELAGVLVLAVGLVSFGFLYDDALTALGVPMLPVGVFMVPALIWAVLRLRPRETVLVMAVIGAVAVAHALAATPDDGIGPVLRVQITLFGVGGSLLVMLGALVERACAEQARQQSQVQLALALRSGGSGAFEWDPRSDVARWTDELLALYGLRREQFGGRAGDWLECLLPEDREAACAAMERSLESGEFRLDYRIRRRDSGEIRWMAGQARVFFDEAGEPLRMIGVNTDITERKQTEDRLRESEARFRLMADAAPVLIWMAGTDGGRSWFNLPWLSFTGRAPDDERGRGWAAAVHPADIEHCQAVCAAALDRREAYSLEYRLRRHDGSYRWLLERGLPRFSAGGDFAGFIGSAIDISEHRQALTELEASHVQLAAILGSLNEGVLTFDLDGNILNMNPAAQRLLGADIARVRRHWLEHTEHIELKSVDPTPAVLSAGEWPVARVLRGETFANFEVEMQCRRRGFSRIVSCSGAPVRGADGTPLLGLLAFQDVSERWRAEQALRQSHERLTLALAAGHSGTFRWDGVTGRCEWSAELLALYGLASFSGRLEDWMACILPEDRPLAEAAVRLAFRCGEAELVCRIRRQDDGRIRWLHGRSEVRLDAAGRAREIVGVQMDITAHRLAEERIHQQAMLLDLTPDPTMVWEERDGLRYWNRGCEQIYGYSAQEALGKSPQALLKTVFPVSLQACRAELEQNGGWAGELRHTTRDGRELVVESWMRLLTVDGRPLVLEATRDVTERKAAEAAIRRFNAELEQRVRTRTAELEHANEALLHSNEELQRFAYIASHDLQTPLRSVVGFAQLLQRDYGGQLDEHAQAWIERVVEASRHMHALVRDLLAYSRVDAQARPFEPTDFNSVVESVLDTLKETLQETGAEVGHGELPTVAGDPVQLTQLVQNLVENGIKYRGAEPPRVDIRAERQDSAWVFSVRDNGIGIDPKQHEAVFELFRRLHTQQAYPGTGIGLAIARRVIERHGGRIWVESRPGAGSTFRFTLPAGEAAGSGFSPGARGDGPSAT